MPFNCFGELHAKTTFLAQINIQITGAAAKRHYINANNDISL